MREPLQFGKHTLYYEEPGIALIVYRGPVSLEEMRILCDVPDQEEHEGRFQLTLTDMRDFGGMDSASRKLGSDRPRPAGMYYTAYVGASFTMRAIVTMWVRATNILQGPKNAVGFFDNYDSARAWLIARRLEHVDSKEKPRARVSAYPR